MQMISEKAPTLFGRHFHNTSIIVIFGVVAVVIICVSIFISRCGQYRFDHHYHYCECSVFFGDRAVGLYRLSIKALFRFRALGLGITGGLGFRASGSLLGVALNRVAVWPWLLPSSF